MHPIVASLSDLDLNSMTFVQELDLDIQKMYLHIKRERSMTRYTKLRARTGDTDRLFCSGDLDLDPMGLIYGLSLDISSPAYEKRTF